jgi:DNA helicase-2/ATP-dependent DNA helicase PcrA
MSKFTSLLEAYASMPVPGHVDVSRGTLQMSRHDVGQLNGGWLTQFYHLFCAYVAKQGLDDVEDDEVICPPGRVPIMTMHQSKGLEFPFVFVGHANADARPSSAHDLEDAFAPFPLNPARVFSRPPAQTRAELDLIRQYFVAYSRAQYALIIIGATNQTNQGRIPCGPSRTWLRNNSINI